MRFDTQRTNNTALPNREELSRILETEVHHDVPKEKMSVHYPKFDVIIKLFDYYGVATDIYTNDTLNIHDVVTKGKERLDALVQAILTGPVGKKGKTLLHETYQYLSEEDQPLESDLIFVFGGKTMIRPAKAAELYAKELGNRVMVSGGNPIYENTSRSSEATRYKDFLVQSGVLEDDIIVEEKSITIPDNVRRSINLLDEMNVKYSSIILVNSPYAQRRGWAVWKKHLSDKVTVYRVNSETSEKYSLRRWYMQEDSLRVVLNEYVKMRASVVYNTA